MFVTTISVFARAANQVCFKKVMIRTSSKVATVDESDESRFLAISRHRQMVRKLQFIPETSFFHFE